MTDASATQMVQLFGSDTPKLGVLNVNKHAHHGTLRQPRYPHAAEGYCSQPVSQTSVQCRRSERNERWGFFLRSKQPLLLCVRFARPGTKYPGIPFPRGAAAMAPFPKIFGPPKRLHE